MEQMLELSHREFKVIMFNILRVLMGKEYIIQNQITTVSKHVETIRKCKKC